jgi:2-keto-3-deoxy-6-phosphogluconate aldolase
VSQYSKAIAAVVASVLSALLSALTGDETISPTEWVNVAILGVGAVSVFAAPNVPGARYTKAALAVLTAILTLLVAVIADGAVSTSEWLQLGVAALGALGVYAVPNSGTAVPRAV